MMPDRPQSSPVSVGDDRANPEPAAPGAPPPRSSGMMQFVKYALCGGLATAVDIVVFFFLSIFVFQAVQPDDPMVLLLEHLYERSVALIPRLEHAEGWRALWIYDLVDLSDRRRLGMFILNKTLAFLVANLAAYLTNVRWVFQSGRHSRRKEIGLFYAVSGISYLAGLLLASILIERFGVPSSLTYGALVVASALINFICRKYFIFQT